ncbi:MULTISPECIES: hypothetical protein [unclassified Burkholderia]|uniref:hypothetical protein n=1 Tax=unclassified Burkholderia TaxID=2613784 RepID=UPI001BCF6C54|nr:MULTISPECIES: hypothetical protein [unclassified Burkholderia]QVN12050.1 hypothetical protein JYG37_02255 [Burkholderia sp. LAS2]
MAERLYKVYVQTLDHPHVLEMIVSADSKEAAEDKALGHIKEANPTKGRSLEESQKNSVVLSVKKAGKSGCIVTNKIPVLAFKDVQKALKKKAEGKS